MGGRACHIVVLNTGSIPVDQFCTSPTVNTRADVRDCPQMVLLLRCGPKTRGYLRLLGQTLREARNSELNSTSFSSQTHSLRFSDINFERKLF